MASILVDRVTLQVSPRLEFWTGLADERCPTVRQVIDQMEKLTGILISRLTLLDGSTYVRPDMSSMHRHDRFLDIRVLLRMSLDMSIQLVEFLRQSAGTTISRHSTLTLDWLPDVTVRTNFSTSGSIPKSRCCGSGSGCLCVSTDLCGEAWRCSSGAETRSNRSRCELALLAGLEAWL
jgi:hypothetical protein